MKKIISSSKAPKPVGIYSQGIVAGGMIFVSGQLPINPDTNEIVVGGIKEQTRQVFKNIAQILSVEGATLNEIVKISAFLLNLHDFKEMNEVFQEVFSDSPPARTTTTVKAFPPGVLIEIDAIAVKNSQN